MCAEARDAGYIRIAFMSDAVAGRSAARGRHTIVRQNVTFPQIYATLVCGESVPRPEALANVPIFFHGETESARGWCGVRVGLLTRAAGRCAPGRWAGYGLWDGPA